MNGFNLSYGWVPQLTVIIVFVFLSYGLGLFCRGPQLTVNVHFFGFGLYVFYRGPQLTGNVHFFWFGLVCIP